MKAARRSGRDGFVLIAVLSVLALLSAMVVVALGMSRDSVDAALLTGFETRRAAIVQSGLSLAAYELFQLGLPPERLNGQQFRFNEGTIVLSATTDTAKVDLNASGRDLLAAAYKAAGLVTLSPQRFADRVIDWRDADDKIGDEGAEAQDYSEAQRNDGPRNGPFRNVDDLRGVLGVSRGDVEMLREFVTIHNPRGRLNAYAAPGAILAALPKMAPETVEQVLDVRKNHSAATSETLDDLLLVQASMIDTVPPATYRVVIRAQTSGSMASRDTEVVIAAGVTPGASFYVLHWSGD